MSKVDHKAHITVETFMTHVKEGSRSTTYMPHVSIFAQDPFSRNRTCLQVEVKGMATWIMPMMNACQQTSKGEFFSYRIFLLYFLTSIYYINYTLHINKNIQ